MRKFALLITVFLFSACAGQKDAIRDGKLDELAQKNARLEKRIKKLEGDTLMLGMQSRMQDRFDDEIVKHIKFFIRQFEQMGYEFVKMEAGYAQLDKDISVLWQKVLRFHHKLKNKEHSRDQGMEVIREE